MAILCLPTPTTLLLIGFLKNSISCTCRFLGLLVFRIWWLQMVYPLSFWKYKKIANSGHPSSPSSFNKVKMKTSSWMPLSNDRDIICSKILCTVLYTFKCNDWISLAAYLFESSKLGILQPWQINSNQKAKCLEWLQLLNGEFLGTICMRHYSGQTQPQGLMWWKFPTANYMCIYRKGLHPWSFCT